MEEKKTVIPHYLNDPILNAATAPELKLYRPKINYINAIIFILCHIVISEIVLLLFLWWSDLLSYQYFIDFQKYEVMLIFITFLFTLRYTLIWFIKLYQRYAKSETRLRCHMTPSCSEYSILALKKYGVIKGLPKMIGRFKKCSFPGEIDYP